jgi:hypothetical protein
MNDRSPHPARQNYSFHPALLLLRLATFPLTFLFLRFIGIYWSYYRLGTQVNGLVLLFLYAPITLFLAIGIVNLAWKYLRGIGKNPWLRACLVLLILLLVFMGGITIEVLKTADQRVAPERTFSDFLVYFIHQHLK